MGVRRALANVEEGFLAPRAVAQFWNAGDQPARILKIISPAGLSASPRGSRGYSTVTVFARLRGWSTFSPRLRAT